MIFLVPLLLFVFTNFRNVPVKAKLVVHKSIQMKQLASEQISLEKRYSNTFVNNVFKDNILLGISYMAQKINNKKDIDWKKIEKPINYKFILPPDKTFAFHNDVLKKYRDSVVKTTNADFDYQDGFKSDGYLTGDGICHLASLIYWVARNAGLNAYAPTGHDFAVIPEISRQFGVSIYKGPGQSNSNEMQNLYVTNNKGKPLVFNFSYENGELKFSIEEVML
jgi:hypothetical protein